MAKKKKDRRTDNTMAKKKKDRRTDNTMAKKKKNKRTSDGPKNTTQKTKDRVTHYIEYTQ